MTGSAASEQERATGCATRVRLANGPLMGPVLWRVVSMVLARADWPLDRLDDALLVCDALCAHAPAYASDGRLTFSVQAGEREAELRVLDLVDDGAARLVEDAMLPVVGNILERVADRVSVEPEESSERSQLVLVLSSLEARFECLHDVRRVGRGLGLGAQSQRLAGSLTVYQVEYRLAEGVLVLVDVKWLRDRRHEAPRDVELLPVDLALDALRARADRRSG